jgi:hypothetical protein
LESTSSLKASFFGSFSLASVTSLGPVVFVLDPDVSE